MTNDENMNEQFGFIKMSDVKKKKKTPLMKTDKQGITLFDINFNNYEYFIEWNRIDQPTKLIDWILHLTEKDWVTNRTIQELIYVVADKFKFNFYGA